MTERPPRRFFHPGNPWLLILPLLLGYAWMLFSNWASVQFGLSPDPDDMMRLQQVRDLLGGQSWFDLTQYRMNPPDGAPMHWSRLVDVPIAAVILLLKPLLGQGAAEMAARLLVPFLTLAVVMLLLSRIAGRLLTPTAALMAVAATPLSIAAITQLQPLRIDHHGWQLALGLAMALAAHGDGARRSGVVAGLAAAAWMNISVEALPFVAALGAWWGLRWLLDPASSERLKCYSAALLGGTVLLLLLTRAPAAWLAPACDAVSNVHLGAMGVAALWCAVGVREGVRRWPVRLAILAGAAICAAAAMWLLGKQCLDPFAALNPVVRHHWYDRTLEGLPVWKQPAGIALAVLAQPLIGIIGAFCAWRFADPAERGRWSTHIFLLMAATLASVMVVRAGGLANLLALPGTAFMSALALRHARAITSVVPRILATVLAIGIMFPAYAVPLALVEGSAPSAGNSTPDGAVLTRCMSASEMGSLRLLPAGIIAAPLDMGPALLVHTPHRLIASGHHRNIGGMTDIIQFFTSAPSQARAIAERRRIDYVVVCSPLAELGNYADDNPKGLWASLAEGRTPAWLQPVRVPGVQALKVWRVKSGGPAAPR